MNARFNRFVLLSAFVVFACPLLHTVRAEAAAGAGALGSYGASDEDDPGNQTRVWRAYTAEDPSSWSGNILGTTRIAMSSDNAGTFTDVSSPDVNLAQDLPEAGYSWSHDMPTLVYDPADPDPSQGWKLIWNHFLLNPSVGGNHRDATTSWLSIRGAASPDTTWSAEQRLMAGTLYNAGNGFSPGVTTYALPSNLSTCLAVGEAGALTASDGFYMAFVCQSGNAASDFSIPLVRFQHANGQTTMTFKGTLLSAADATSFASTYGSTSAEIATTVGFTAPDLVTNNGETYLIATPMNSAGNEMGCVVFEVTNLETAGVMRMSTGAPEAFQYAGGTTGSYRGSCTASAHGTSAGIVLSELAGSAYSLFATLLQLP